MFDKLLSMPLEYLVEDMISLVVTPSIIDVWQGSINTPEVLPPSAL